MKIQLLSNFDLEEICKYYNIPLIKCISKDLLTLADLQNGGYVINLQNYEVGQGTHWTCFFIHNNNVAYFDSFGQIMPTNILNLFYKKDYNIFYSTDIIQHILATTCGYYCIAFLHFMNKFKDNNNFGTIINHFNKPFKLDNLKENDYVLQAYIRRM